MIGGNEDKFFFIKRLENKVSTFNFENCKENFELGLDIV